MGYQLFSQEGSRALGAISFSLLCLVIAVRAVYLLRPQENDDAGARPPRRRFPGPATKTVAAIALAGGLAMSFFPEHFPAIPEAWQGQGLYRPPPGSIPEGGAVQPVSREKRVRGLNELAAALKNSLQDRQPPASRDGLNTVNRELWCVPGEGGPTYLYLRVDHHDGSSVLLSEPYRIDGEQLAWSDDEGIHQLSESERDAIVARPGRPR